MKTLLKTNLIAFFLLLGFTVSAQNNYHENNYYYRQHRPKTTFGVKAGLTISDFKDFYDGTSSKVGFNAGIVIDYAFTPNVYLSSGLEFLNKKMRYDFTGNINGHDLLIEKSLLKAMYMQIPIHVGYKFDVTDLMKISLHAGPYFAYGVGGRNEMGEIVAILREGDEPITMPLGDFINDNGLSGGRLKRSTYTFDKNEFKRFDWGIGLGILFEYDRVGLGVNYDFGLNDISRTEDKVKVNTGYITLGYRF